VREVSIIGATFYGNHGAEAMLLSTIQELASRFNGELHVNIFSYYPKQDEEALTNYVGSLLPSVSIFSATPMSLVLRLMPQAILARLLSAIKLNPTKLFSRSLRSLSRSDGVICLAGVSFSDKRLKFLPFNILTILIPMMLGVKVYKFAQALGPFEDIFNRALSRIILIRCRKIYARGDQSYINLRTIGLPSTKYELSSDVAFLFPNDLLPERIGSISKIVLKIELERRAGKKVIGFCPSSVLANSKTADGEGYAVLIAESIEILIQKGYQVIVYPTATRPNAGNKRHNNDLYIIKKIENLLKDTCKSTDLVFAEINSAFDLSLLISACDFHIVSRFHAMVLSLKNTKPTLAISWGHKYLEVMGDFSQSDMVIDVNRVNVPMLIAQFENLVDTSAKRQIEISKSLPVIITRSRKQFSSTLEDIW